ncbi:hypothetical protein OSB04_025231 [Centaurea solstitialis]|uniref:Integrase catalytic domain-containing protein n=1 Tax=Centaurea solstitialis TaxID=347529 RepID=A0AA38WCW2_9ASTR|nr:hypothetical protein OSB04_025231 [Centaurea solstitialis]
MVSSGGEPNPKPAFHPAFAVSIIRNAILLILNQTDDHYASWVEFFNIHVCAYNVSDHIDEKSPRPTDVDDATWDRLDALVKQWIYSTISPDLGHSIMKPGAKALDLWKSLQDIFLNNKTTRAVYLEEQFNNTRLASFSNVTEYCARLKNLADQLHNVGNPVSETKMVLQLISGLTKGEYDTVATFIQQTEPLPSFNRAKSSLLLEEARRNKPDPTTPQALVTQRADPNQQEHPPSSHNHSSSRGQSRGSHRGGGRSSRDGYRGNNNGRGRGRGSGRYTSAQMPWQWPNWYALYPWNPPPCPYPTAASPIGGTRHNNRHVANHHQQAPSEPQAHFTTATPPPHGDPMTPTDLGAAFQAMQVQTPDNSWYMDTGSTSHITNDAGNLSNFSPFTKDNSILVGNGSRVPILGHGNAILTHLNHKFRLNNTYHIPNIIKNLVGVKKFTRENNTSVEFDPFGFTVKDLTTKKHITRCDSPGDLYPITPSTTNELAPAVFHTVSPNMWHNRLGHPAVSRFNYFRSYFFPSTKNNSITCNACSLGKHCRLPFTDSVSVTYLPFDIIHADLWTSPITSKLNHKYYLVLIDDYTHYTWTFPLKAKSETYSTIVHFYTYIKTQFSSNIKSLQCDNGREFNNTMFTQFCTKNGIHPRFTCPYTSSQNGKAERIIRTLNNMIRTSLLHASLPPSFWNYALHTSTYLINLLPSRTINNKTPAQMLYLRNPTYDHLRTFGCLCYPNTSSTTQHKLAPRSLPCVFLGYPDNHRGYLCLPLSNSTPIISRHVTFHEHIFPYSSLHKFTTTSYDFLDSTDPSPYITHPHLQQHPSSNPPSAAPTPLPPTPTQPPPPIRPTSPPPPATSQTEPTAPPPPQTTNHLQHHPPPVTCKPVPRVGTWELVPRPSDHNIIRCHWLFRHKFRADGTLERYKARLVVNGKTQQVGIDCEETFSPVVKPATIRTVLSLAMGRKWDIHQLDVKNAFLHGHLQETVYMHQPPGFFNTRLPDHVCKLRKSLYGLNQAPRAWYQRFANYLLTIGFVCSKSDTSLFVYNQGDDIAYLLLYVDDIVITASSTALKESIIAALKREFDMTDLGPLSYFLGIAVTRNANSMFLSQRKYIDEIIKRANMETCKPVNTPVDTHSKLSIHTGEPVDDPSLYRSLAGALQYLTITRPDIAYAVQQICLFMHAPKLPHFNALKRIIRYLKGTHDHGLTLYSSASTQLVTYTDADWGGCPDTRRSTSGYCIFLGDNLVSWSAKRQPTLSRSSAEAEYRGVANVVAEACWLRNLLLELHNPLRRATIVYCDNVSAVYLSGNPVQHQRPKHIEMDIHFVREKVAIGQVRVLHVPSAYQFADIFTKGLPRQLFLDFRDNLSVRPPPAQTAGDS